jgi:uncharacterized protein (TIGR03382 family)
MTIRRALIATALSLTLAPLSALAGEVWVASATEKIRPDAKPRADVEARIAAARNEFEAFQVVVTGAAKQVSAKVTSLTGPGTLDDVKLYREDLINVKTPSALDGATGRWPDALVPDVDDVVGEKRNAFPFDVAAGESRAIWVEVHVPRGAKPGEYRGEVKVTTAEGDAKIPVTLVVWDFELPSTSSLRSAFNLSYGILPSGHPGVSGDADAQLRARYGQLALDHHITVTGLNDDGFHNDMGHFDRFYGPLADGKAPTQLEGAKLTTIKYVGNRTSVPEHKMWAEHFKTNGWFDRLFDYTCDEPPLTCAWNEIAPRAKSAHDADPNFKTLVTTQIWDAQEHGVADDIDIMVPVINWIDDKPGSAVAGNQRARYDEWLKGQNKELWLYQSCMSHGCGGTVNIGNPSDSDKYYSGWPSYMIDASASRNRAMEWMSFLYDATGELYWETAFAYRHDAWSNQWDFSGNGDGTLFYPGSPKRIGGNTDIPVSSVRLKMIREGMEDYEYLKALADAGDADGARRIARDLFPNAYSADVQPEQIAAAREQVAKRILELKGKSFTSVDGAVSAGSGSGSGGGGCGSTGGFGGGALLALPLVLLLAQRRRVQAAVAAVTRRVR